jgi:hypothetical protein
MVFESCRATLDLRLQIDDFGLCRAETRHFVLMQMIRSKSPQGLCCEIFPLDFEL